MIRISCFFLIILAFLFGGIGYGQEVEPERGIKPNSSLLSGGIDDINLFNMTLNLSLPMASLPSGRGGSGFDLALKYDSHLYNLNYWSQTVPHENTFDLEVYRELSAATQYGGWNYNIDNWGLVQDSNDCDYARLSMSFPDGSRHIFHLQGHENDQGVHISYSGDGFFGIQRDGTLTQRIDSNGTVIQCALDDGWQAIQTPAWLTYYTSDGTYLKLMVYAEGPGHPENNEWHLFYPDGKHIVGKEDKGIIEIYDSNGHKTKIERIWQGPGPMSGTVSTRVTDAVGREIYLDKNITDAQESVDTWKRDAITAPGPNGPVAMYVDWELIQVGGYCPECRYKGGRKYTYSLNDIPGITPPSAEADLYRMMDFKIWVVRYIHGPYGENETVGTLGTVPPLWKTHIFGYSTGIATNNRGYGELNSVQTPSGAQYSYLRPIDTLFTPAIDIDSPTIMAATAFVSQKTILHDGASDIWAVNVDPADSMNRIVTDPNGGQTQYTYLEHFDTVGHIEFPDGSTVTREWAQNYPYNLYINSTRAYCLDPNNSNTPPCATWNNFIANPYIASEVKTLSGPSPKSVRAEYQYDKNGNLRKKKEFDWTPEIGNSLLLRETEFNYCKYVSGSCLDAKDATDNSGNDTNAYWQPVNMPAPPEPQDPNNFENDPVYQSQYASWISSPVMHPRLNEVRRRTIRNGCNVAAAVSEYVYNTKGNVIEERRWDSAKIPPGQTAPPISQELTAANAQILTRGYDSQGNLTNIYEPEIPTVNYYLANGALGQVEQGNSTDKRTFVYGWNASGTTILSKTDFDNHIITSHSYDNLGRETQVNESIVNGANQRRAQTYFDDEYKKVKTVSDLRSYSDGLLQTINHYDQLGRVVLSRQSDGTPLSDSSYSDGIKVQTIYGQTAGSGRFVVKSSPYRNLSDSTLEWSCTQYDRMGQVLAVAMFKGSVAPTDCYNSPNQTGITTTLYDADWTTVTDPASKVRRQRVDALGRLAEVVENPQGLNYNTSYAYDALDNLVQVNQNQGGQTRTFVYSSLGRLLSATNPESGTIIYQYHDSGDLWRKTDARNIWSEITYDSLHRPVSKNYSDGTSPVSYNYYLAGTAAAPNIGQLQSTSSTVASTVYSYNWHGKVAASAHGISGHPDNLMFGYDWYLNGGLKRIDYPSGRQVNYDVDDAGRTNKGYGGGTNYADMKLASNPYTSDGRLAEMKLGNNLWETRNYNTPGTPSVYRLGTGLGDGSLVQLEYNFSPDANNGNVQSQTISRQGHSWQQNFTYDGVNRLWTAQETGGFSRQYGYDQYGNRWVAGSTGLSHVDTTEPTSLSNFNSSNNRLAGLAYDAAGNQTAYGSFTLGYDAENRTKTVSGNGTGTYSYDGDGRRVKKVLGTTTTYYFYNALGQLSAEYSTEPPASVGTSYLFTDMLGSTRAITSSTGVITECYDYLSFGRMLSSSDNGRSSVGCFQSDPDAQLSNSSAPQKFTGKERDQETGLDYFGARYYSGAEGRFTCPDPVRIRANHLKNPSETGFVQLWRQ
jgi:RHS repeat-associated protein